MSKPMNFEVDEELLIYFSITPFSRGNSPDHYYGPSPDVPEEIEDLCIMIDIDSKKIDITSLLDKNQKAYIENLCFQFAKDREEYERERD